MSISTIQDGRRPLLSKFNIALFFFSLWLLAQLIIPVKYFSYSLLSDLEIFKNLIPAIAVVVCTLLHFEKLRLNRQFLPFFIFGSFCALKVPFLLFWPNSTIDALYIPMMYVLWTLLMFSTSPAVLDSLPKIRSFLRCMIIIFSIVIIIFSFFVAYFSIEMEALYRGGRLTFIYSNPLYLGAIAYSILCCSLLLREMSGSNFERKILLLLSALCLWVLFESFSRTFMLATVVLLTVYLYVKRVQLRFFIISTSLLLMIFGLSFYIFQVINFENISSEALNSVSSGRILNWGEALYQSFEGWNVFWGGDGSATYNQSLSTTGAESVDNSFQRYSVDNTYIEVFINSGVIGFSIFMWGLINLLRFSKSACLNIDEADHELDGILAITYAILVSLVVSALFYGHFPSFGNTINAAVFPPVLSVIFLAHRRRNQKR